MDLGFVKSSDSLLFKLTPPQTKDAGIPVSRGCFCFVIDVSGSMNAAAEVTTDDGDKVSHGWSQLDISKHACNTVVSSLDDGDYVAVITYSDSAKTILNWTRMDAGGKNHAIATIDAMRPERSTNLMAGIVSGLDLMKKVPEPDATLGELSLNLIVCTDGMPSPQWHPARGREGYAPLVGMLIKKLTGARGKVSRPAITTIGLGSQLDSDLLQSFSDAFLHMPDPGSVGPFMVNMLAAQRSTARLPTPAGTAANECSLLLSPASAIASCPGYQKSATPVTPPGGEPSLRLKLGAVRYDQPRHVVIELQPGATAAVTATLELHEQPLASISSAEAAAASPGQAELLAAEKLRLQCVDVLDGLVSGMPDGGVTTCPPPDPAPMVQWLSLAESSVAAQLEPVKALIETVRAEIMLGVQADNWSKWGVHYGRSLMAMLRTERRSNFRDKALQHFGRDAQGREALFDDQSSAAEMTFATLKAPEPSLLQPQAAMGVPLAQAAVPGSAPIAAPAPQRVLPDEFMRGGGCFAPQGLVSKVDAVTGAVSSIRLDAVRPGDLVRTADGGAARVRCVVATECEGGRAELATLPGGGPTLTCWHPVRDARGKWRFPGLLGQVAVRACPHVLNLVLDRGHELLVDGVACVTLGHGLQGAVVGHAYWGTDAVLADLSRQPGWAQGFVLLRPGQLRAAGGAPAAPPPALIAAEA